MTILVDIRMIIIKFGGSVITNKAKKGVYNSKTTQQLLAELREFYDKGINSSQQSIKYSKKSKSNLEKKKNKKDRSKDIDYKLILIHGAGSFGHISAKKYKLNLGYQNKTQLMGLSEVHQDVRDLNLKFMNDLLLNGFPGISIPPMVILRNKAKMIAYMDSDIFQKVLDMHCIPITFGDVVPDETLGFSICSGDTIIQELTKIFKPTRVIFITDVDGVFTLNPKDSEAKLIRTLTPETFLKAYTSENQNPDVTGGIYLKASIALALAQNGVDTYIINGTIPGRLTAALYGKTVNGTIAKGY